MEPYHSALHFTILSQPSKLTTNPIFHSLLPTASSSFNPTITVSRSWIWEARVSELIAFPFLRHHCLYHIRHQTSPWFTYTVFAHPLGQSWDYLYPSCAQSLDKVSFLWLPGNTEATTSRVRLPEQGGSHILAAGFVLFADQREGGKQTMTTKKDF